MVKLTCKQKYASVYDARRKRRRRFTAQRRSSANNKARKQGVALRLKLSTIFAAQNGQTLRFAAIK